MHLISLGKLFHLKIHYFLLQHYPYNTVKQKISQNSQVMGQTGSLVAWLTFTWFLLFFTRRATSLVWALWYTNTGVAVLTHHVVVALSGSDNVPPHEQIPAKRQIGKLTPGKTGSKRRHKCNYSMQGLQQCHTHAKSLSNRAAQFPFHTEVTWLSMVKDSCNVGANISRGLDFPQGVSDLLFLPTTASLMQRKKWTKIKAVFLPCEKTEEFPLYSKDAKIYFFLDYVTNSTEYEKHDFPKY